MTETNLFDTMDDYLVGHVCQELYNRKEYRSLYYLSQTNKRINGICQKFLDSVHQNIIIMITFVGERHEYSTPIALITLDKFKKFINNRSEGSGYDYYMTIMIPNKHIADEGDFSLVVDSDDKSIVYLNNDKYDLNQFESYIQMIELIRAKYDKLNKKENVY